MDNQSKNVKKGTTATLIVTRINVFAALMVTISWFLTWWIVFIAGGKAVPVYDILAFIIQDPIMCILIVIDAVTIIWAAIPKKWAAIVGMIYAILITGISAFFFSASIEVVNSDKFADGWATGFIFKIFFSILLLILSVVKLVLIIRAVPKTNE